MPRRSYPGRRAVEWRGEYSMSRLASAIVVCGCLMALAAGAAEEAPIMRLADVAFQVRDLDKAREFYGGVMGYAAVFRAGDGSVLFKVNDDQYVQFMGGPETRMHHVSLLAADIREAHRFARQRQLSPGEVEKGADGNPRFALTDPDGTRIEFVEYVDGSAQVRARGRSAPVPSVAAHLLHAALAVNEAAAMPFYRDKLGFREFLRGGPAPPEIRWINMMMPGKQGDYVELMVHAATPAAARQHLCFAVDDIQAAYRLLRERGVPEKFKPFLAQNNRYIINLRDGNGIRVELMAAKDARQ